MVSTIDVTYFTYLLMDEEYQDDYNFTLQFMKNAPETKDYFGTKDLSDLSFMDVKDLQNYLIEGDMEGLYNKIVSLPDYSQEKMMNAKAYEVILTLQFICNRLEEITNIENTMLQSKVAGEDYSGIAEQVDFSMFPKYYSELRELAGGDITKFDEIKRMKYSDCLVELIYRQKQADFEKLVMKQHTNRRS